MTEKLIVVSEYERLRIYKFVSKDEVRGRYYRRIIDPSTKSGLRWTRQPDVTLYRHEDEVWRTSREEEEMKEWIADFDIRDDWVS